MDLAQPEVLRSRRAGRPARQIRATRVLWALAVGMAVIALCTYLLDLQGLAALPHAFQVPWPLLAIAFYASEVFVVHIHFRKHAHSFSMGEIPLVLGFFLVSPGELLAARLLGAALALAIHRRNTPLKLAFNLSLFALETVLATDIFRALTHGVSGIGPAAWAGVFTSTAVSSLVNSVAINFAISLSEGKGLFQRVKEMTLLQMAGTMTNSSLGLAALGLMWQAPLSAGLLLIPLLTVHLAYRSYTLERRKHESIARLHGFGVAVQGSVDLALIIRSLLIEAQSMFRAGTVEVITSSDGEPSAWLRSTVTPDGELRVLDANAGEDAERLLDVLQANQRVMTERDLDLGTYLAGGLSRTALAVALRGESGTLGFILVRDRQGEQSRFDREEARLFDTLAGQASAAIENARLETQLRAAEQTAIRLGRILDESLTEIYLLDAGSLRIMQANPAALTRLGYSATELQSMKLTDLLDEADAARLETQLTLLRRGIRNQVVFEGTHHSKDGTPYPIEARILVSQQDGEAVLVAIAEDVSERVRADEAVRESEAKSRFLAGMSHELRTPLNSILGFSQLLLEPTFGELTERQLRYVANISSSGQHLLELINDVLDLSKIQAGRMEVTCVEVAVEPLVEDCLAKFRPQAQAKSLALSSEMTGNLYAVADATRLRQVLLNLLSNAVKFTGSGGSIVVESSRAGDGVQIMVRDTGRGIPPADLDRMFEEFTQLEVGAARNGEGTGLGLPLSRRMVELMGGQLTAESQPGIGSTFRVALQGGEWGLEPPHDLKLQHARIV